MNPMSSYILAKNSAGGSGGGSSTTEVTLYTESQYYTAVGREFNIYWDNISTVVNPDSIVFTASTSSSTLTITNYDECMRITSTAGMVGNHTVTVTAKNKFTDAVLATKTFILTVLADDALAKVVKAIFIGDSLTNGDYIQRTVKALAGSNFTLYGTLGVSPNNHEGRVSWASSHYLYSTTYNTYSNPFYNAALSTASKFDFAYYISNNPTFSDVNLVNIFLGRNAAYDLAEVDRVKIMVDSIKAYNPNIVVTLTMAYHLGDVTLKPKDLYSTKTKRLITYNYNAKLKQVFGGYSKLYIIPQFINLDNFYDHGPTTKAVSARNTNFTILSNGDTVHLSTYGYQKLGDLYYGYFKFFLSDIISATATTVPATGITLSSSTLTFSSASSQTLTATVTPSNTTDTVTWASSDTSIATVSGGVVTAKANGTCTITATCGSYSATCTVTVSGIAATTSFALPTYDTAVYPYYLVEKDSSGNYYMILTGVQMTSRNWNSSSSLRYYSSTYSSNYKHQYQTSPDGVTWTIQNTNSYASNSQLTGCPQSATIYKANYSVDTYVYSG